MNRPTFEQIYMNLALELSKRSTCNRLQVGAVLTTIDFRQVISLGYNGNYNGGPHQCDSEVPGQCGCLHAEDNCIINCNIPRHIDKYLFVTTIPCKMCAKRIINLGNVKKIFYKNDYRLCEGLDLLQCNNVKVIKL